MFSISRRLLRVSSLLYGGGMKKNLLFLSSLYPSTAFPNRATFNCQQVNALSKWFDVSVLVPMSWREIAATKSATWNSFSDATVIYPTYWYSPGVLRSWHGQMMFASIASYAKRLHQKKSFDLVLGSWLYPDGWVAAKLAKLWNIPCYLKVHGTDVNRLQSNGRFTEVSLESIAFSNGVICVSKALKNRLIELGVNKNKCHVIYNGIDKEIFHSTCKVDLRKQLEFSVHGKLIVYIGNLIEAKGLRELARAFGGVARSLDDVRLLVIGAGPWSGRFMEMIKFEGVEDKVGMLGSVRHAEIGNYVNAADVLCLPSYMEGIPNVVLEALACDTRVVATSVGGIPELAREDDRITLVVPRDATSLQGALEHVLTNEFLSKRRLAISSWSQNAEMLASILTGGSISI